MLNNVDDKTLKELELKEKLPLSHWLIMSMKANGRKNNEIAEALNCSTRTVTRTWKQIRETEVYDEIEKAYFSRIPKWLGAVDKLLDKPDPWIVTEYGKRLGLFTKEAPTVNVQFNKIEKQAIITENLAKLYGQENALETPIMQDVQVVKQVSSKQENASLKQDMEATSITQETKEKEGETPPPGGIVSK